MGNGTRYQTGDFVQIQDDPRRLFRVREVRNPNSDSPDYVLENADWNVEEGNGVYKASDIEKIDEKRGYEAGTIADEVEEIVIEEAKKSAVRMRSNTPPMDNNKADMVVAQMEDYVAKDGELVDEHPDTDGLVRMGDGGKFYGTEEEIDIRFHIERVADKFNLPEERVEYALKHSGDLHYSDSDYMYVNTPSGSVHYYKQMNLYNIKKDKEYGTDTIEQVKADSKEDASVYMVEEYGEHPDEDTEYLIKEAEAVRDYVRQVDIRGQ